MLPKGVYTVRGVTGTLTELIQAFGVRYGASTIRMRMYNKGWDLERALLDPGPRRLRPTRLADPAPIPQKEDRSHWSAQKDKLEKEYNLRIGEILIMLVSMGLTNDEIKDALGIRVGTLHYESLQRKAAAVVEAVEKSQDISKVHQTRRAWRMRHFDQRKSYGKQNAG